MAQLGIDFGTSNTAAGVFLDGTPTVLTLEHGEKTLPTAVFFDFRTRQTLFGTAAVEAMIAGEEGRFMRALKSVLGTSLAREKQRLLNERVSLIEVIARFLAEIRARAEDATGQKFDRAISGRPVRFHSSSAARNDQALLDLEAAYEMAGFKSVRFVPEPEAAAMAVGGEGRILIVDIGGGTSDFTLCDRKDGQTIVLGSHGIRLGGTDFDKLLSLAHVMPLLGYGCSIGNEFGPGSNPAPRALFHELASWEKIPFVYDPATLRDVRRWIRLAPEPEPFARLAEVLDMHLGHDLAFAVEAGKIEANGSGGARIDLSVVERGLCAALAENALHECLHRESARISGAAQETLRLADCAVSEVDRIVFVGGSSLLRVVQDDIQKAFPAARLETSDVFTAVVDGLALAAGQG